MVKKKRLSFRGREETLSKLQELSEALDCTKTEAIEKAIDLLYQQVTTGDIWVGTGVWKGWRLTTAHAASSHGQPVLVAPDGTPYGPGDIQK